MLTDLGPAPMLTFAILSGASCSRGWLGLRSLGVSLLTDRNTDTATLSTGRGSSALRFGSLLRPFDIARERTIAPWLRIVFFSSILFNHTVPVEFQFVDERAWVVWLQTLRDFGAVGFFLIAGSVLKRKMLSPDRVVLPSNLLKLAIAAAALAAFDMLYIAVKGGEVGTVNHHFYKALYDTNLWFFVAYAIAGPLLLSLDRRGVFRTFVCCLLFIMFPGYTPLISPYILQSVSLAFVCMAIGAELHGRQMNAAVAIAIATVAFLLRTWLDDYGYPAYPAIDIVLRIVYGVACYMLFKAWADALCRVVRPPGWANYLFVPYIIQLPLTIVVTVFAAALFTRSLHVNMPPIFFSFWESLAYSLTIFGVSLVGSFVVAWLLRRYEIRL